MTKLARQASLARQEFQRKLVDLRMLVNEQAEDEGLWFEAETASEVFLQEGLRRLHEAVEAVIPNALLSDYDDPCLDRGEK